MHMSPRAHRGRNEQLIRLLAIIRALQQRGGSDIYELAAEHSTATRTILRDLAALEAAGLPLVKVRNGRRVRWRIEYRDALAEVSRLLDASHYLAVLAALGAGGGATNLRGTRAALTDLASKVASTLTPDERLRLARVADAFGSAERRQLQHQPSDILVPLVVAIAESRLCDVNYTSVAGKRSRMIVLPLRVFTRDDALYVFALLPKRSDLVTLAIHRVRSMRLTSERGAYVGPIDVDRYAHSLFGVDGSGREVTYRLRFDAEVAPYIRERSWHPSQHLRRRKDGGVELSFTCRESVEVTAWVASWREHVHVDAPAGLKTKLAELGQTLSRRYG